MTHLLNGGEQSGPVKLELVKFRVIGKPYSKWNEIFAETGGDDTLFKSALFQGYGIRVETNLDPVLYIIEDTAQHRELREIGVHSPTFAQLLTSTKVISLSEQDAINQMNAWLDANRVLLTQDQPEESEGEQRDECEQCGCEDYSHDLACCPNCGGKRP